MDKLNIFLAQERAKDGERIYADYNDENEYKYFTLDMLVHGIIECYKDSKYPNHNIDTDCQDYVYNIMEYVKMYEEKYKEWHDEEKDNMDYFFTYDYVKEYLDSSAWYNEYKFIDFERIKKSKTEFINKSMTEYINENYTHPHTEWDVKIYKRPSTNYLLITDDCCEIVLDLDSVYNCLTTCKGYGLDWNNVYNCYEIMRDKQDIIDYYNQLIA